MVAALVCGFPNRTAGVLGLVSRPGPGPMQTHDVNCGQVMPLTIQCLFALGRYFLGQ